MRTVIDHTGDHRNPSTADDSHRRDTGCTGNRDDDTGDRRHSAEHAGSKLHRSNEGGCSTTETVGNFRSQSCEAGEGTDTGAGQEGNDTDNTCKNSGHTVEA